MSGETAPRKIGRGYARNPNAGPFHPMIGSFDLHLRAEHKSSKTISSSIGTPRLGPPQLWMRSSRSVCSYTRS
jgi:hypothetical protein